MKSLLIGLVSIAVMSFAASASVRVEVPQSEVGLVARPELSGQEIVPVRPSHVEFSVARWQPNFVSFPSRIDGATAFQQGNVPQFGISSVSPRGWITGLFVTPLSRSGVSTLSGESLTVDQLLVLVTGRLGVERSYPLGKKGVSVFGAAALCPTLGLSSRSRFDDSREFWKLPVEFGAGVATHLGVLNSDWKWADLRVSVVSLSGLSLRAGLSVALD